MYPEKTSSAEQTSSKIGEELKQLNATLSDIEDARPFSDLTLHDIAKARPQIPETVDSMVKHGKWTVPGYTEKSVSLFSDLLLVLMINDMLQIRQPLGNVNGQYRIVLIGRKCISYLIFPSQLDRVQFDNQQHEQVAESKSF